MRALTWDGDLLYAARGYTVLRASASGGFARWEPVASFDAGTVRSVAVHQTLARRLLRAGFHGLKVAPDGRMFGVVGGAIVVAGPGERRFRVSFKVRRGTRPLALALGEDGSLYWGEYFGNPGRTEVFVYGSRDRGETWSVVYRFPAGAVRHVHNVLWDRFRHCFWIFTGDYGGECRVLKSSPDWANVETVLDGDQGARVAAAIPTESGLYFATDSHLSRNSVRLLDTTGKVEELAPIASSCLQACAVGRHLFFSTAVEPSRVNRTRCSTVVGSGDGRSWSELLRWEKDACPSTAFGFGNILFPEGANQTNVLATTGQALAGHDAVMELWRVVDGSAG